jgi:hypothetical protein
MNEKNHSFSLWMNVFTSLWEKKSFAIGFTTQFLSCIGHLQLTIYIVQLITIQLQICHNNSFSTTMQLPYDYNHNFMLMSFLSIHQNLTHGIMRIFRDLKNKLISIVHYDYSF